MVNYIIFENSLFTAEALKGHGFVEKSDKVNTVERQLRLRNT